MGESDFFGLKRRHADLARDRAVRANRERLSEYGLYEYGRYSVRHKPKNHDERNRLRISDILATPEAIALLEQCMEGLDEKKFPREIGYNLNRLLEYPVIREHFSFEMLKPLLELCAYHNELQAVSHHEEYRLRMVEEKYFNAHAKQRDFSSLDLVGISGVMKIVHEFLMATSRSGRTRGYFDELIARDDTEYLELGRLADLGRDLTSFDEGIREAVKGASIEFNDDWFFNHIQHNLIPQLFEAGVFPGRVPIAEMPKFIGDIVNVLYQKPTPMSPDRMILWVIPDLLLAIPEFAQNFSVETVVKIKKQITEVLERTPTNQQNLAFSGILPLIFNTFGKENVNSDTWPRYAAYAIEFVNTGGRAAADLRDAFSGFEKMLKFPEEWERYMDFLRKHINKSSDNARLFQILNQVPNEFIPILRSVFDHDPKMLVPMARELLLAKRYEIEVPKSVLSLLARFPAFSGGKGWSEEDAKRAEKLLKAGPGGRALISAQYAKLKEKNGVGGSTTDFDNLVGRAFKALQGKDAARLNSLLNEISSKMGRELLFFLKTKLRSKIVTKAKKEFDIRGEMDEKALFDESSPFFGAYMAYRKLITDENRPVSDADKQQARNLLKAHLEGRALHYVTTLPHNAKWLQKYFPGNKARQWLSNNAREYAIDVSKTGVSNTETQLREFSAEAVRCFALLEVENAAADTPTSLIERFRAFERSFVRGDVEKDQFFRDLKVQIQSLEGLLMRLEKNAPPTAITISMERDPLQVLAMGDRVEGSCLAGNRVNYWSVFPNAIDVNKAVLWIRDQNSEIVGRVLIGVDDNGKIVRFRTYYAKQVGVSFDPYVDAYVRSIAQEFGLGINGESDRVATGSSRWYNDGGKAILEPASA